MGAALPHGVGGVPGVVGAHAHAGPAHADHRPAGRPACRDQPHPAAADRGLHRLHAGHPPQPAAPARGLPVFCVRGAGRRPAARAPSCRRHAGAVHRHRLAHRQRAPHGPADAGALAAAVARLAGQRQRGRCHEHGAARRAHGRIAGRGADPAAAMVGPGALEPAPGCGGPGPALPECRGDHGHEFSAVVLWHPWLPCLAAPVPGAGAGRGVECHRGAGRPATALRAQRRPARGLRLHRRGGRHPVAGGGRALACAQSRPAPAGPGQPAHGPAERE